MAHENPLTIDAELRVPIATAQLVHLRATGPADNIMHERHEYWLDLCLTPRPLNARACYHKHWSPNRFERLGTIFIVPPGETIKTCADGGPSQASVLCHLRPEPLRQWLEGDLQWTDEQLAAGLDIRNGNIRHLLLRLASELREPGFASEMLVELIAAQLAIEMRRHCHAVAGGHAGGGLAPWRLRLIDERLKELRKPPTLEELAKLCKLSVRQLTRGFRASRGYSIGEYAASSQLDHAKELLASSPSIKSVAYSLGFSSPSSFCSAFRRATMETPGQFRQRLLHKQ